jgi:hypothetical protein
MTHIPPGSRDVWRMIRDDGDVWLGDDVCHRMEKKLESGVLIAMSGAAQAAIGFSRTTPYASMTEEKLKSHTSRSSGCLACDKRHRREKKLERRLVIAAFGAVPSCVMGQGLLNRGCGGLPKQDSAQLLAIFAELEANNLFLIQNLQAAEESIEDLQARRAAAQARLEGETATLRAQHARLAATKAAETEKLADLKVSQNRI